LNDPDPNVRGIAAGALGEIGDSAKPAAAEIAKLLFDFEETS
jgi:HEAT repeat protein